MDVPTLVKGYPNKNQFGFKAIVFVSFSDLGQSVHIFLRVKSKNTFLSSQLF